MKVCGALLFCVAVAVTVAVVLLLFLLSNTHQPLLMRVTDGTASAICRSALTDDQLCGWYGATERNPDTKREIISADTEGSHAVV